MSAKDPADVARLHAALAAFFARDLVEAELRIPWDRQQLRGEIFAACEVLEERAEADGAVFRVRGRSETIDRLRSH
jgi:GTP-binding protein HflX